MTDCCESIFQLLPSMLVEPLPYIACLYRLVECALEQEERAIHMMAAVMVATMVMMMRIEVLLVILMKMKILWLGNVFVLKR